MISQLRKSGVYLERSGDFDVEQTVYVMDVPLLKTRRAAPREYWFNPEFSWNFNAKAPIDFILPLRKRNPPKLDRVAIRYASRIADKVIAGIKSGKIKGDTLYEEEGSSFRGHWEYGLKIGKRPINLTVVSPAYEGSIFVPDERHLPVQIKAPGWKTPDRSMFIHELVHYLQAEHGQFAGTARGTDIANYLDQTHERDAYFAQMIVDSNLKRVKDPAKAAKTYFTKRGLWQQMKAATRQHHVDRLAEFLTLMKPRILRGKTNPR
jgi:hypothetical protein